MSLSAKFTTHRLVMSVDYDQLFADRTVFITGISRSGSSIVAKIVGSLSHTLYIHEPIVVRYIPPLVETGELDAKLASQMLKGILFEDYYLQVMHGRNLNLKRAENSYFGNYDPFSAVRKRWTQFPRRNDVLEELRTNRRHTFVMKMGEVGPILPMLSQGFPGLRVIHLIRNGHEVISSTLRRGWYTDEYMNSDGTHWTQRASVNLPWYVPEDVAEHFTRWNVETRVAYLWRTLVPSIRTCSKDSEHYMEVRYEDLIADPEAELARCEQFVGQQRTPLTMQHVDAVRAHTLASHENQMSKIDPEELPHFQRVMREQGYA